MNVLELAEILDLTVCEKGNGDLREITSIYCCDLLSIVMGRAKPNSAWITVMANINSIAVGTLANVSCIIISEDMQIDNEVLEKAKQHSVCVLKSPHCTFDIAKRIAETLKL
jgi:predicted transcriptional regulator